MEKSDLFDTLSMHVGFDNVSLFWVHWTVEDFPRGHEILTKFEINLQPTVQNRD